MIEQKRTWKFTVVGKEAGDIVDFTVAANSLVEAVNLLAEQSGEETVKGITEIQARHYVIADYK